MKTYNYSGRWLMNILGLLLFGGCTSLFYFKAISNSGGLIINNVIELSKNGASIFFWVFFTLSLLLTLMSIYGIYVKIKGNKCLIIDDSKIIIPAVGFQKSITEIPFSKLSEVDETKVSGNSILTLYFENKKSSIASSLLTNKNEYSEIKDLIYKKMYKARTPK